MMTPLDTLRLQRRAEGCAIGALFEQIARLEQRIVELEARLEMDSTTSSKPPSSDGYGKPEPKSRRGQSGKTSGGQKGHTFGIDAFVEGLRDSRRKREACR